MNVKEQSNAYNDSLPETKPCEIQELHYIILPEMPVCKLWFLNGKVENGKIVANPNIGYGAFFLKYADGATKEFYQIGLSANTKGVSEQIFNKSIY